MSFAIVLDAAAFDHLDSKRATSMRALLRCAVDGGGQRIRIVPTDERFAKLVGAILHDTASGSERIADAHIVAACTTADAAIVLTADPHDIVALATAVPGTRIVTRDPQAPL